MAINWKELEKILSELPLKGSYIQDITEHDYHSFTLSLFEKEKKAYYVYTEVATVHSRFVETKIMRPKSKNMQRFTQFLKAHVRGKKITDVYQLPYDRAFILFLESPSQKIKMLFRLYSGPGANVIVLTDDDTILDLLFRRPQRGEVKGEKIVIEERKDEGSRKYTIREYKGSNFNEAVEREESNTERSEKRKEYIDALLEKKTKAIAALEERKRKTGETIEKTKDFDTIKHYADLLSSSLYLYKKGMSEITLDDWETGEKVKLSLSEKLDGRGNLDKLYTEYHKEKTQYSLLIEEKERIEKEIEETKRKYDALLGENTPLEKLKEAKDVWGEKDKSRIIPGKPGLYIKSGEWEIIVGRNAKENDAILRSSTRGNDTWMHTRDFAGGYVIIKAKKNMTVPLEVLLDGAYLAIFFSKARKNNKADLYYTQVKYLKRIKGAKMGLIIPTQEKNLSVDMDEKRVRRLLGSNENEIS